MQGEDVALLQLELLQIGFDISSDEVNHKLFGPETRLAVANFQRTHNILGVNGIQEGVVDEHTAELINLEYDSGHKPSVVKGTIFQTNGVPAIGTLLRVFDKDLRNEELLGEQVIDKRGTYEIHYSSEKFARVEKQSADLIFRLFDQSGKFLEGFIANDGSGNSLPTLDISIGAANNNNGPSSAFIIYNAPEEQTVNFIIRQVMQSVTEYERLINELEPLTINITVNGESSATLIDKIADLKKEEMEFLSAETGIELSKIEFLFSSAFLQKQAAEQQQVVIPAHAFYALARTKGLVNLVAISSTSIDDLRSGLIEAGAIRERSQNNIIPPFESEEQMNGIVQSISKFAISSILTTQPAEDNPSLTKVLELSLPSMEKQVVLLQAYANRKGTVREFWKNMRQHPDFLEEGQVEKVQFALQLAALTQNSLQLMNSIQNEFRSTQEMARMGQDRLTAFFGQVTFDAPLNFPGDTPEEKKLLYTKGIIAVLQTAFPTETAAHVISKVPDIYLGGVASSALALFINRATDTSIIPEEEKFDICSSHIDTFIEKHGDMVFANLDSVDKDKIVAQVKRMQRLFQVSTCPETFQSLLESKFNSANDIAQTPLTFLKDEFMGKIDVFDLELIHQRAMSASAVTLHLALQAYQSETDTNPMVIG